MALDTVLSYYRVLLKNEPDIKILAITEIFKVYFCTVISLSMRCHTFNSNAFNGYQFYVVFSTFGSQISEF